MGLPDAALMIRLDRQRFVRKTSASGVNTLVVWKLDRLSRSIRNLIDTVGEFERLGIGFRSLTEAVIDTTTPSGKLIFHVFSALAEYERGIINERTRAGLVAARARGSKFGRPTKISDKQWASVRRVLATNPDTPAAELAALIGVSRQAVYRRPDRPGYSTARHLTGVMAALPTPKPSYIIKARRSIEGTSWAF